MHRTPTLVRLAPAVLKQIDKVLAPKEKRADLIRAAVERELKRRGKVPR
jgi:metal-responsive CopG/Arc/MetJ family transcriptional regulator